MGEVGSGPLRIDFVPFTRSSAAEVTDAGRPAQHPRHLGRRHRHLEPELLQRRPDGLPDPQHRPDRRRGRPVHRLLRRAELHGRPSGVHLRPEPDPHRPDQGGHAGRDRRPAGRGPDHRHRAAGAGLRHRPVRQEPPGRPGRAPAHRARLRRVLRQPLPPQRRGGAGAARLPQGRGVPRVPGPVRATRCHPLLGQRRRDAADRGHRTADQEADGDGRRRVRRGGDHLHPGQGPAQARRSSDRAGARRERPEAPRSPTRRSARSSPRPAT